MTTKPGVAMVLAGCVIAGFCLVGLVVNGSRTPTASPPAETPIESEFTVTPETAPSTVEPASPPATETAMFALG